MWDERYNSDDYAYGTTPNDFLSSVVDKIPKGRVLCLAEGEGRNSVFLAEQGYEVLAVDSSSVGLQKAQKLASSRNVTITTECADLAEYTIPKESFAGIVSIFCHLPPAIRKTLHRKVVEGLKPGGVLILEAYTPEQLTYKTGGPPVVEMTMTLSDLKSEFVGLKFLHELELIREVVEGKYHTGTAAVVQIIAIKPEST